MSQVRVGAEWVVKGMLHMGKLLLFFVAQKNLYVAAQVSLAYCVRERRVELLQVLPHWLLRPARLPISPPAQIKNQTSLLNFRLPPDRSGLQMYMHLFCYANMPYFYT